MVGVFEFLNYFTVLVPKTTHLGPDYFKGHQAETNGASVYTMVYIL